MKQNKLNTLSQLLRAGCSAAFILTAILSVGLQAGRAAAGGAYTSFAALSALSAPEPAPAPTDSSAPNGDPVPTSPGDQTAPSEPITGSQIIPVELSLSDGSGKILFKNETSYTFDTSAILTSGYPIEPVGDEPSVLILHTHATESYTAEGADTVTDTRSDDPSENMIAIGKELSDALAEHGVSAIHCTVQHDAESYSNSYSLSSDSVQRYLEEYPSIRYIIDVHRDAIATADGGMAKPVITHEGTDLAQLMLVVGTDEGGADHPGWKTNLCVAVRLQQALMDYHDNLVRPINLRSASFNQQLCPGFFLLEIGSCANTPEEAKASARIFATVFADLIQNP